MQGMPFLGQQKVRDDFELEEESMGSYVLHLRKGLNI